MSTVKAINFQHPSATAINAATTSGGDLTNAAGVSYMGGNKNLLYNGAMQVAQRGTSTASITTGGYYTADRWYSEIFSGGTWTQSVENDAPTGSGFRKSLKALCTTASSSLSATAQVNVSQRIEGQDLQRIAKGTASAQQLTLSFWVKANSTGTYVAELYDGDNGRQVSATYTVSASATWERKTITFPADATGAFDNDNNVSLYVVFWLVAGSNYTSGTLNTAWAANNNANRAVGQTNLAASTNNYWQITGVQLEVGPVATSFEFKSFGQELAECQRYYYRVKASNNGDVFGNAHCYGSGNALVNVIFPVTMRTSPGSLEQTGTASDYRLMNSAGGEVSCSSVPAYNRASPWSGVATFTVASGVTAGNSSFGIATNTTAYLGWSAEL